MGERGNCIHKDVLRVCCLSPTPSAPGDSTRVSLQSSPDLSRAMRSSSEALLTAVRQDQLALTEHWL